MNRNPDTKEAALTLGEALRQGKARLKQAGKPDYAFDAELLLEKAAGLRRTAFFLRRDEVLAPAVWAAYDALLAEREANRPTQYILGEWEFMGLPFAVGEGVLIPRADTETLVETVLEVQKKAGFETLLDIGTGSGCIPVSLGHYGAFSALLAVDKSPQALAYAAENAAKNGVEISFYESDLFSAVPDTWRGRLGAIVSNPPYIPAAEIPALMAEVRDFEPHSALDGGADGLVFYRKIAAEAKAWLRDGGRLFFEIGYDQGAALLALMEAEGYTEITLRQDLAGRDRVVFGRKGEA